MSIKYLLHTSEEDGGGEAHYKSKEEALDAAHRMEKTFPEWVGFTPKLWVIKYDYSNALNNEMIYQNYQD